MEESFCAVFHLGKIKARALSARVQPQQSATHLKQDLSSSHANHTNSGQSRPRTTTWRMTTRRTKLHQIQRRIYSTCRMAIQYLRVPTRIACGRPTPPILDTPCRKDRWIIELFSSLSIDRLSMPAFCLFQRKRYANGYHASYCRFAIVP